MRRASRAFMGLALVAALGAAGLWGTEYLLARTAGDDGGARGGPQAVRVTAARPEPRMVADSVAAVGSVHPAQSVALRPLARGRVEEVFVASGATVDRGDPILALDDRAARAEVARAEATREAARQELRRIEELSDENVTAEARLEEVRAAAARAAAEVDAARAALEDRRLAAPFSGTLGIVTTDRGDYVDPATAIAPLDDLSSVEAAFDLPEEYFARVAPGQSVRLTSAVYPERAFSGTVTVRAAKVDRASRSFEVRATLDNPQRRLAGGMFVEAEIVFDQSEALTVPDDAIVSEGATSYVFTIEDGIARRTEIALGAAIGPRRAVTDGLSREDRIVVTGWDTLTDGDAVTIAGPPADEALN